ncbi:hypothetical protein CFK37_12100 [Virgibacillus phasianinus]|uniref:DUF4870 domain-containing protein n=1 Tax=Virgibacillus phasianinus TaxID=2017483 RepID=A0A220U4J2_9BACI|nr:DUF4870 domain-containing protein [Virgibacillus phasianinus]ASK62836.1 hypothetical protein CFK37_12100 [Virgibacillus phasianinus]
MSDYNQVSNDERLLAMLLYLVSFPLPILGPLVIWLIKRDGSAFIDYHGKEYFNFFISYSIYAFISTILIILLIGLLLIWIVGIMAVVFTIVALIKAYSGERYRFPLIFRLIK